jgi:VWFA-related protein
MPNAPRFRRSRALAGVAAAVAAVTCLATAFGAAAQDAPRPPDRPAFSERLDVELVDFEVVVTTRDGTPVRGLGRDDFEVLEDGEPVELSHFVAVDEQAPPPGAATATAEAAPPERPLYLGILVERVSGADRKRMFEAVRERLAELTGPGDRVLVASVDTSLKIEQRFCEDPELVSAALGRLEMTVGATSFAVERQRLLTDLARAPEPPDEAASLLDSSERDLRRAEADELLRRVHSYAAQASVLNQRTFEAIRVFVDSMAGLPGRKVVLLLSGGLEVRPVQELFEAWDGKYTHVYGAELGFTSPMAESGRYDRTDLLRELIAHTEASRVTIYGVAAAGDPNRALYSAAAGGRTLSQPLRVTGADPAEALRALATATGGMATDGVNTLSFLLDRMAGDVASYYVLGYTREPAAAGGAREDRSKIEVVVRRPADAGKLEVRHRKSHLAKSSEQRTEDQTLAALLHDVTDNPLGVKVEVGTPQRDAKDRFMVPLVIRVPLAQVLLVPAETMHHGRLSVVVAVQDEQGRLSAPQHLEVPVDIENDRLMAALVQDLGYQVTLQMRGGEQKLAVGVIDQLAAVTSTLNLSIPVSGG